MRALTALAGALLLAPVAFPAAAQTAAQLCAVARQQGNEAFLRAHCAPVQDAHGRLAEGARKAARKLRPASPSEAQNQQAEDQALSLGLAAYNSGDYAQALNLWLPAATRGNAMAENNVGMLYYHGLGVTKDLHLAIDWCLKSALQGDAKGESDLGYLYELVDDYASAVTWSRKAAVQGDVDAEWNIGVLYESGEGVPKDLVQARYWFEKAAASGNANAIEWLAQHPQ